MSQWAIVKLSDVATLSSGGTPSKANAAFWDGDIPWVSPKDMKFNHVTNAEDKITRAAVSESAARIVGSNSVLAVVRSGILAHTFPVATLAREVSFNQDIKAITPKNGSLLTPFLFWMLKGQEAQILRIGVKKGATVHSLSNGFLESLRFLLPPLDEQRRIVGLLDRAAEIRRRADAARAKARAIIPALFLDTFGDPATNPKGWPMVEFGKVIKVSSGNFLPAKSMSVGGIFPVYGGNGINGRHSEFMFEDRKIVIGRVGAYCGNVHLSEPRSWITDNALYVAEFPQYFLQLYLVQALKNAKLNERSSQAGQPLISAGRIATVPLLVPHLAVQNTFAEQAQRLESTARALDAAAAKAEAMAAGLSAEVFG